MGIDPSEFVDCLKRGCVRHQIECAANHADYMRVVAWVNDLKRKPATLAFTDGPERQLAYLYEKLIVNVEG